MWRPRCAIVTSDLPEQRTIVGGAEAAALANLKNSGRFIRAAFLISEEYHTKRMALNRRNPFVEKYSWENRLSALGGFGSGTVGNEDCARLELPSSYSELPRHQP